MKDLIEALQILLKYGNPESPTHCSHDILRICGICPKDVSERDRKRLDELGFSITIDDNYRDYFEADGSVDFNNLPEHIKEDTYFYSFTFGSA